jgi:hypothetical protein
MGIDSRLKTVEKHFQKTGRGGNNQIRLFVVNDEKHTVTCDGNPMDWEEYEREMAEDDTVIHVKYTAEAEHE